MLVSVVLVTVSSSAGSSSRTYTDRATNTGCTRRFGSGILKSFYGWTVLGSVCQRSLQGNVVCRSRCCVMPHYLSFLLCSCTGDGVPFL
uniref:Putative secreted protein n=1 Tax=Anopheles darlingi TaxID=43151 RepID=A0A2M4DNS8_ANODA